MFSNKNLAGQGYKFDENEKNKSKVLKYLFKIIGNAYLIYLYIYLGIKETIKKTVRNGI